VRASELQPERPIAAATLRVSAGIEAAGANVSRQPIAIVPAP